MKKNGWVDFKAIKEKVSIKDVLSHYDLLSGLKEKGDSLTGSCPIHQGSNKSQFKVSVSKNCFNCFGDCGAGGNVLDFVSKMEKVSLRDAALLLCKWFDIGTVKEKKEKADIASEKSKTAEQREAGAGTVANKPLTFELKNLDVKHSYLNERGLTDETIRYFGLGYCSKGLMKDRVVIPIHNENNELVAYAGRAVDDTADEKYKLPAGFKKSLVMYNLNRIAPDPDTVLIVVEGFFDVFALHQAGFHNVVALMGSSMSEEQSKLIAKVVSAGSGKVVLVPDGDEAGQRCLEDCLQRLFLKVFVKAVKLKEGKQPEQIPASELKSLI